MDLRLPTDFISVETETTIHLSYTFPNRMLITVRKRICGKVMFPQACVKNSVHSGEKCTHPWADTPSGQTPYLGRYPLWPDTAPGRYPLGRHPPGQTPHHGQTSRRADSPSPLEQTPTDSHCSGRYASYGNAFLYILRAKYVANDIL